MGITDHRITLTAGRGNGLALVLSGLRYGTDKPLLAAAADVLCRHGAALMTVDFAYAGDPEFSHLADEQQFHRIEADGRALLAQAVARCGPGPLWIAGKSLGTVAMGGMLAAPAPPRVRWLWLTPSLSGTRLASQMVLCAGPSLSLIGSRDPSVALTRAPAYRDRPGMTHHECTGVDHGWTHEAGAAQTLQAEAWAAARIAEWSEAHG
ncbi:MAG: hypothetical protein R3D84_12620 [Paracoccaceae bacterium]